MPARDGRRDELRGLSKQCRGRSITSDNDGQHYGGVVGQRAWTKTNVLDCKPSGTKVLSEALSCLPRRRIYRCDPAHL